MFNKILYISLIALGILGILDTIFVSRFSVGLTAGTLAPGAIGIVLIVFAILKLTLNGPIIPYPTLRTIVIVCVCSFIAFFVFIESFILVNAYSRADEHTEVDYVIVLGCGVFPDGRLTLTLQKRLNAAYTYLQKYPDTMCIVSGGQGYQEPTTEALAMSEYLLMIGLDEDRILQEDRSTSTKENIVFSKEIISNLTDDENVSVAITTSDFHIFRTKMLAKHYGLDPIGIPCNTTWYIWINSYLREFLAVVKSFIFDM